MSKKFIICFITGLIIVSVILFCPWYLRPYPCPDGSALTEDRFETVSKVLSSKLLTTIKSVIGPEFANQNTPNQQAYGLICRDPSLSELSPLQNHGKGEFWYQNGQSMLTGEWQKGEGIYGETYDILGRILAKGNRSDSEIFFWHANGQKAIQGQLINLKRHGLWREWDQTGTLIGEVEYDQDVPGSISGTSRLLLHDIPERFADSSYPFYEMELPNSNSTAGLTGGFKQPSDRNLNVEITKDSIQFINGGEIKLDNQKFPDAFLNGQDIPMLYQRIRKKMIEIKTSEKDEPFVGELLVQADHSLLYSELSKVLDTASRAAVDRVVFLTEDREMQWPPRSGLTQMQGKIPISSIAFTIHQLEDENEDSLASKSWQDGPLIELKEKEIVLYSTYTPPTTSFLFVEFGASDSPITLPEIKPGEVLRLTCRQEDCAAGFNTTRLLWNLGSYRENPEEAKLFISPAAGITLQTIISTADLVAKEKGFTELVLITKPL